MSYIFPTHVECLRLRGVALYYVGNSKAAFESLNVRIVRTV